MEFNFIHFQTWNCLNKSIANELLYKRVFSECIFASFWYMYCFFLKFYPLKNVQATLKNDLSIHYNFCNSVTTLLLWTLNHSISKYKLVTSHIICIIKISFFFQIFSLFHSKIIQIVQLLSSFEYIILTLLYLANQQKRCNNSHPIKFSSACYRIAKKTPKNKQHTKHITLSYLP